VSREEFGIGWVFLELFCVLIGFFFPPCSCTSLVFIIT
jgi:hypothetical protein